jgi:hypothetical protein
MLYLQNFLLKSWLPIEVSLFMRYIILGNVLPFYGIVTHHLGTIFWGENLISVAFLL